MKELKFPLDCDTWEDRVLFIAKTEDKLVIEFSEDKWTDSEFMEKHFAITRAKLIEHENCLVDAKKDVRWQPDLDKDIVDA